jgi:tripartite-type tricarboxylate transporter receptor subunit TctC
MKRVLWFVTSALLMVSAAAAQTPAKAEGYPARPVKVVVPYPPGAAADLIGRVVARKLSEATGGQFYVENVPGAGGTIGTAAVARAPADGYTILVMNQDFVVQPAVRSKVAYDAFQSFAPVAAIAAAPETISVHPSLPATSMQELVALLKANPGKYSYASPGYGTSPHVACERLFRLALGLDVVHVPFQGGGPAVSSTLAGHTPILHITLPLVSEHIKDGKLRGLAVADKKRSKTLLDVPTLEESGITKHEVGYWTGILVPAETPKDIVQLLNRQVAKLLAATDVKERLSAIGFDPLSGSPEDFGNHIKAEFAEWSRVVGEAKLKIE